MQQPRHAIALRQRRPDRLSGDARRTKPPTNVEVAELLHAIAGAAPPTAALAKVTDAAGGLLRWHLSGRRPVGFVPDPVTSDIDAFISRLEHSLATDRRSKFAKEEVTELLVLVRIMRVTSTAFMFTPYQSLLQRAPPWPGTPWHLLALHTARVMSEAYLVAGIWPSLRGKRRLLARLVHALLVRSGVSYSVDTVLEVLTERQEDYEVWRSER